eukprot:s30_g41.t1
MVLRISSAASGDPLLTFDDDERPQTVRAVKAQLMQRLGFNRFRLKLLCGPRELSEEDLLISPLELQLVIVNLWPPEPWYDQRFLLVCQKNRLDEVELLLHRPQDPETRDAEGKAALHFAAEEGHLQCVELLLEAGARLDLQQELTGTAPLHLAAEQGHLAVVRLLLQRGADKDLARHVEVVKLLLDVGADKDKASAVGATALHLAALNGHMEVVHLLLRAGVDRDKTSTAGATALHLAALNGHPDVLKVLLDHGAPCDVATATGKRPLHGAALYGHASVVRMLLEFKADKELVGLGCGKFVN